MWMYIRNAVCLAEWHKPFFDTLFKEIDNVDGIEKYFHIETDYKIHTTGSYGHNHSAINNTER